MSRKSWIRVLAGLALIFLCLGELTIAVVMALIALILWLAN